MPGPFDIPPGVRFTCSECGDCCRGPAHVPLSPAEAKRIAALPWDGEDADLAGLTATARVPTGPAGARHRLARREDGACVFLSPANRCRIHGRFGEEEKPLACRTYPFAFRRIADHVAVDVAFSCRAVSLGQGTGVETRLGEWVRLLEAGAGDGGPERHLLAPRQSLPGDVLRELENHLVALLRHSDMDPFARIRCCLQFAELATTGDPRTEAAVQLRHGIARGLVAQAARGTLRGRVPLTPDDLPPFGMDATQRAVFYQWLFLALNPAPPNYLDLDRRARRALDAARVLAGTRFRDRVGRPLVDRRELNVTFAEVASVDGAPFETAGAEALSTFLVAKVVGQRFLLGAAGEIPLTEAVPRLLLAWPMALWTAKALAADRGARAVAEEDVRGAVRLVDRTLGQLHLESLPRAQAEAFRFVMTETDLVVAATEELLGGGGATGVT